MALNGISFSATMYRLVASMPSPLSEPVRKLTARVSGSSSSAEQHPAAMTAAGANTPAGAYPRIAGIAGNPG